MRHGRRTQAVAADSGTGGNIPGEEDVRCDGGGRNGSWDTMRRCSAAVVGGRIRCSVVGLGPRGLVCTRRSTCARTQAETMTSRFFLKTSRI
jgi:hypothetical protein